MPMMKMPPAGTPDEYVAALSGWQGAAVAALRAGVRHRRTAEVVKWGHLVYLCGGPVLLIRAEATRVLLGFWRGQRLRDVEPRLKPGGKYEMATLELHEGDALPPPATLRRLVREAVALNDTLGNPTDAAPKPVRRKPAQTTAASRRHPGRQGRRRGNSCAQTPPARAARGVVMGARAADELSHGGTEGTEREEKSHLQR